MSISLSYSWKKISQKLLFPSTEKDYELIATQILCICSKSISSELLWEAPHSWNAS